MSSWVSEKRNMMQTAQIEGFKGADATVTGFTSNYQSHLAKTITSELSVSSIIADQPKRDRWDKIREGVRSKRIPKHVIDNFKSTEAAKGSGKYDALADYLVELGYIDAPTTEQLNEDKKNFAALVERDASDNAGRAGISGKFGAFIGGMHAVVLDPVNIAISLAIPGVGPATTAMGTAAKHGAVGAVGAAAYEAVVQPIVYNYKQDLGLEYSFNDAMTNAAFSIVLGGTISAAAGGIAHKIGSIREARKIAEETGDTLTADRMRAVEEVSEQLEFDLRNAPDLTANPFDHDRAVIDAGLDIDNGVKIDLAARQEAEAIKARNNTEADEMSLDILDERLIEEEIVLFDVAEQGQLDFGPATKTVDESNTKAESDAMENGVVFKSVDDVIKEPTMGSDWIMADGRVAVTPGDHAILSSSYGYDSLYSDMLSGQSAIRASFIEGPEGNAVMLHMAEGQKLTDAQYEAIKKYSDSKNASIMYGTSAAGKDSLPDGGYSVTELDKIPRSVVQSTEPRRQLADAKTRVEELEGKMAIAITCIKGE